MSSRVTGPRRAGGVDYLLDPRMVEILETLGIRKGSRKVLGPDHRGQDAGLAHLHADVEAMLAADNLRRRLGLVCAVGRRDTAIEWIEMTWVERAGDDWTRNPAFQYYLRAKRVQVAVDVRPSPGRVSYYVLYIAERRAESWHWEIHEAAGHRSLIADDVEILDIFPDLERWLW